MKFRIERASGETPPCEGAVRIEYKAGEYDEYLFPNWTYKGKKPFAYYEIEVDSLEQLLEIAGIEGHGIIVDWCKTPRKKEPRIIIYDDYIE